MKRSGQTPTVATHHLEDVRELVTRPGPFLTVIASCPEPIAKAVEATVREVRHAVLATAAARRADDVADAVAAAFPHAPGVVVVTEPDGLALVEHLSRAPRAPGLHFGALPVLGPILEQRASSIPVVMAMVDRTGADIGWSTPLPAGATARGEGEVQGETDQIRKVHAGGWSHRRYQQRAEDAWERTAHEVAAAVAEAAAAVDARLVVLGGEARMVQLVRDSLPGPIAEIVREVPGSRSEDGSEADREAVAKRWLRSAVAEDTRSILELFAQEKGQADRATDGLADTLAALRESRVDLLLVTDRGVDDDDATACFTPADQTLVARTPTELDDLGADDVRVGRAVDVAIRAALLTGADVRLVPATPRLAEGIGALLRW